MPLSPAFCVDVVRALKSLGYSNRETPWNIVQMEKASVIGKLCFWGRDYQDSIALTVTQDYESGIRIAEAGTVHDVIVLASLVDIFTGTLSGSFPAMKPFLDFDVPADILSESLGVRIIPSANAVEDLIQALEELNKPGTQA